MEFNINKEQLKGIGNIGLKIGKSIVIEGTKALVLKAAAATITQGFEEGFGSVKDLTLDDVLEGKKRSEKRNIFKKKTNTVTRTELTKEELESLLKKVDDMEVTN